MGGLDGLHLHLSGERLVSGMRTYFLSLIFFLLSRDKEFGLLGRLRSLLTGVLQMRSLKYVLLPDSSSSTGVGMQTVARSQRNRRTQFLAFYSCVVQLVFMWILTRQDSMSAKAVGVKA